MLVKIGLDSLDEVLQLGHLALDARLCKSVIVLDPVQQPPQAPEAVRFDLINIALNLMSQSYRGHYKARKFEGGGEWFYRRSSCDFSRLT